MLDVLEAALPRRFSALDLGAGPGSLGSRLVTRFPRARVVGVDFDPVLLEIGRHALFGLGPRLSFVEADLTDRRWTRALPAGRWDAAVSTNALHWLGPTDLRRLYRDLYRLLRPGGVFLNGDYIPWPAAQEGLRVLARRIARASASHGRPGRGGRPWQAWWAEVAREPAFATELALRRLRFPREHPATGHPTVDQHERWLRAAGFREVAVVSQVFEERVLYARR